MLSNIKQKKMGTIKGPVRNIQWHALMYMLSGLVEIRFYSHFQEWTTRASCVSTDLARTCVFMNILVLDRNQ